MKIKEGRLGEVMGIGWILGEEILYSEDNTAQIIRLEKCEALVDTCVLTFKV